MFGFHVGPTAAVLHGNVVCSFLGVFHMATRFNLFDGAFIKHSFSFYGGCLCGDDDAKEKHGKASAGYAQGINSCRRLMHCGSLEGAIMQDQKTFLNVLS